MFVDISVDSFNMQRPMNNCVEEIEDQIESWKRKDGCSHCNLIGTQKYVRFKESIPEIKIRKRSSLDFADGNEQVVCL